MVSFGTFIFLLAHIRFFSLRAHPKTQNCFSESRIWNINRVSDHEESSETFIDLRIKLVLGWALSFNQLITDFYIADFPQIRIKTDGGEVIGQLNDAQNELMIILNENGIFKSMPWDQIKTMEIKNTEKDKQIWYDPITRDHREYKPCWKFW